MRFIGLDVGRDFAHVAVVEGSGTARRLPRVAMGDEFRGFAATLGPDDAVALEASTNTWALADLLGRHAGRVVVSNPLRTKAIASAKRKTDDIDAATLAELLAADYLPPVWQPDEATRRLRRLTSHRAGLVHDRTAVRNRVAAVLSRRLVRAPMTDVFGIRGRAWLGALDLPPDERLTVEAALALDAVLCAQVEAAERFIATMVVEDTRVRRLLTIPGIGLVTAASILAVVGDIGRFDRPAKLVSYLGLDPRVRQSGDRPAMRGHISRAGQAHARGLLCEAAHSAVRSPGPLAGFHARLKARRGGGVAIVATARKLAVIVWHLLTKDEDCRFAPEARTTFKQRQLDRLAGRPGTRSSHRGATGSSHDQGRARLRGGHDPHDPALRHAIDRVHPDGTPPSGA
ncbi:MAG: IS110 family transposase [Chloroflexota bacterium]|nr:IS110 family transposase [Chloroflexota bacterium]